MIPHQGMSMVSLGKGILGMLVLILMAYTLSNNRKNISWKIVGLGLLLQIIIAIAVIKISWIKGLFEYVSGFFVKVLEYTQVGAQMLLGEFANSDEYGFVFVYICMR